MKSLLIILLLFSACGKNVRQDPSPPAFQSNYPTAEIRMDDQVFLGQVMLSVAEGTSFPYLSIQTYYNGTIRIDGCGISYSKEYENNEVVSVPFVGVANKNCIVSAVVSPTYPSQSHNDIQVYSFQAHIGIRVIKSGESWVGFSRKVSGNFSSIIDLNVGGTGPVRAVFQGCNLNFDKTVSLDSHGYLHLDLNTLTRMSVGQTCVLEGVIISPIYQDLLVNVLISDYDPTFVPLPFPILTINKKNLNVVADSSVSVISLDSAFLVDNQGKFKFDETKNHIFRALTMKGRSVFCEWKGSFSCQQ